MDKRLIIWDFDGVVIDSANVQKKALEECYRIYGKGNPPYDLFFSLSGNSLLNIFSQLELPLNLIEIYIDYSRKKIDQITVFEGIPELLSRLRKKHYILALCTGKERRRTMEILDRFYLTGFFSYIVCSDDVINPKPDSEGIKKCLNYFCMNPHEAVMIGDAGNDIIAAKNASVYSIGVLWGEGNLSQLQESDYLCNSVKELEAMLLPQC